VNASFGVRVAVGLYFIGLPRPILWGVVALQALQLAQVDLRRGVLDEPRQKRVKETIDEVSAKVLSNNLICLDLSLACRIIRTFSCDRHIVNVALAQASR
jgi:hypothetical protein